jgi:two-component system, chemotaxis family, chemotaxis protein CheY
LLSAGERLHYEAAFAGERPDRIKGLLRMMGKSIRVLVVDDSKVMRNIIKKMLAPFGLFEILEAKDGKDAWEKLQKESVDLILSDWNMPRMKGIELLRKVRADGALAELPFVMVTAEAMEDNVAEATEARVTSYLTKPFTPEGLKSAIQDNLRPE